MASEAAKEALRDPSKARGMHKLADEEVQTIVDLDLASDKQARDLQQLDIQNLSATKAEMTPILLIWAKSSDSRKTLGKYDPNNIKSEIIIYLLYFNLSSV